MEKTAFDSSPFIMLIFHCLQGAKCHIMQFDTYRVAGSWDLQKNKRKKKRVIVFESDNWKSSARLTALIWTWLNTFVEKRILRGNFTWITGAKRHHGQLQFVFDFSGTRISPSKPV